MNERMLCGKTGKLTCTIQLESLKVERTIDEKCEPIKKQAVIPTTIEDV